ncbi:MAG: ABC transporter ATP-binding protein [Rhodobacteraceae bacterium]|nr:ABC transporter ATP-binding protein [Paracoccaceae bacterium]
MIDTCRKILAILTPRERRSGALVLLMMAGLAVMEVLGIASITPFLAVLGNPEVVQSNRYLNAAYEMLGFSSTNTFMLALGVMAVVMLAAAAALRIVAHYAMYRFSNMRRHSVSRRLLASHLRQPYEFFLSRNSSDLSKTILSEVDQLTNNVIKPFAELFAYGFAATAVIALLIVVDPQLALVIGAVLGGFYAIFYMAIRGYLLHIGVDRVNANRQRFKAAAEALGGIKELKVLGKERAFFKLFDPASNRFARHHATSQIISQIPKHLIEAIGFIAIIIVALYTMERQGDTGQALPLIGLYALAGYRLLPALQHIYASMTKLRFGISALDTVLAELGDDAPERDGLRREGGTLPLRSRIVLTDVWYTYPSTENPALSGVNLSVDAYTSLAIVGKTGSGKSTLVDIILGLLQPSRGSVEVDGVSVTGSNVPQWQNSLGYVPQHIFLVDDTIAANIALGVSPDQIEWEAVERAARAARIHDFVTTELPRGYQTLIGERGVRLSGGQRQRLGIARALYGNPEVLLLDEATSALDLNTEREVMETIASLQGSKTLIMVAHRLSTVERCDHVVMLEGGRIIRSGRYAEVIDVPAKSYGSSTP